jgi:hypothetical protein
VRPNSTQKAVEIISTNLEARIEVSWQRRKSDQVAPSREELRSRAAAVRPKYKVATEEMASSGAGFGTLFELMEKEGQETRGVVQVAYFDVDGGELCFQLRTTDRRLAAGTLEEFKRFMLSFKPLTRFVEGWQQEPEKEPDRG